jgi:hypothetical protein
MERYCQERRQAGIVLSGIRVEVHAVKMHAVDTYEQGVECLAHSFMSDVERECVEIAEPADDGCAKPPRSP